MKHSIWYLIPFLLAALYFVDSVYEKNLSLKPQASSTARAPFPNKDTVAVPPAAEANLLTK